MTNQPMPRYTLVSDSLIKRVERCSYTLVWCGDSSFTHKYNGVEYKVIEARHIIEETVTFFGIFKFKTLVRDHAGYLLRAGDKLAHGVDWGMGLDDPMGERLVFTSNESLALDTPVKLYG